MQQLTQGENMIDNMTKEEYFEAVKRIKENNKVMKLIIELAKTSKVEIIWKDSNTLNIKGDVSAIELLLPVISMKKKELLHWLEPPLI